MIIPIWTKLWLPAYVLHRSPLVLSCYDSDFLRLAKRFRTSLPQCETWWLLQFGWQHETDAQADAFAAALRQAADETPYWKFVILANSPLEAEQMRKRGLESYFCHQNAFLDPACYPLQKNVRKRYDAVYLARITPFKRHDLAARISSLRLIGNHSLREEAYFKEIMRLLPAADWTRKCRSWRVAQALAPARCGLALSAEEGAMFVSAEYLLSGLPVVNTPNRGGRDFLLPPFAVRQVEPTPDAVADGVRYWCENPVPAEELRAGFLAMAAPHRRLLSELIEAKIHAPAPDFPHKLGLRCRLSLMQRLCHGVYKKKS